MPNQTAEQTAELAIGTGGTLISSVVASELVDVNREEGGGCLCGLDEFGSWRASAISPDVIAAREIERRPSGATVVCCIPLPHGKGKAEAITESALEATAIHGKGIIWFVISDCALPTGWLDFQKGLGDWRRWGLLLCAFELLRRARRKCLA